MFRTLFALVCAMVTIAFGSTVAKAHFQMIYVGGSTRMPGGSMETLLLFTHPFVGNPTMAMGAPKAFYMLRKRGDAAKPEKVDLLPSLERIGFVDDDKTEVAAYRALVPATQIRSLGDYVFVLEPEPYLEASEDKYIQQFTKMIVNVGGVPSIWDKDVGLTAEIRPLGKPYANWTGTVFRGVVLSKGKPVPNAEIEVEYVSRRPDVAARTWAEGPRLKAPHAALANASLRSDANGTFTVGLPKAGWWGIGALNLVANAKHKGKSLSQDAVLWVEVTDVN